MEQILKLTCTKCSGCLSVPPIYWFDGYGYICGRCIKGQKWNPLIMDRQTVYEILAENVSFSCIYKKYGCDEEIMWKHVEEHEICCLFQPTFCPFVHTNNYCSWKGNYETLEEHVKKEHQKCITNDTKLTFADIIEAKICFTMYDEKLITVFVHKLKDELLCQVLLSGTLDELQNYYFDMKIHGTNNTNLFFLHQKNNLDLITNLKNEQLGIFINVDMIKHILNNPDSISCVFKIIKLHKEDIPVTKMVIGNNKDNVLMRNEVWEDIECPICHNYMYSNIRVCPSGHSICDIWANKINICSFCKLKIGNGKNYSMEKLIDKLQIFCRNCVKGCPVTLPWEDMQVHEKYCYFGQSRCMLLDCNWWGQMSVMLKHINNSHKNYLVKQDENIEYDLALGKRISYYVIEAVNGLFRLKIDQADNSFSFTFGIQYFGSSAESNLIYDLSVVNKDVSTVILVGYVVNNNKNPLTNLYVLNYDTIKDYIKNNILTYKFKIRK